MYVVANLGFIPRLKLTQAALELQFGFLPNPSNNHLLSCACTSKSRLSLRQESLAHMSARYMGSTLQTPDYYQARVFGVSMHCLQ